MRRINYKSDVPPLLLSLKVDENQITVPDCDFIVRFYIEGYEGRHYDCSHIGGVWSNCEPSEDGTKLVCYINNQRLGIGELCAEFHYISPDRRYSDGSQKSVVVIGSAELGVELVEDNGDAVTEAAIDVTLPFIYRTAYEIARDHGYTGTSEDFYSALASVVGIADAEKKRVTAEITRNANEQERIENEENRLNAESNRVNAEAQRVRNEAIRGDAESDRVEQEEDRKAKFKEITEFIATVRANEGNRESNERERQANEDTRITEEAKRVEAEKKRAAEFEQQKLDLTGKIDRSGDEMGGDLIFTDNTGVSFRTSDGGAHTMFNDMDDVAKFTADNGDTFEFKQNETPNKNSSAVVVSKNLYNALDMTLDSMGSALDGDAAYRAEAGDKIFNPDTCKIQRYNSTIGGFEDLCDPIEGKLYANKMTGYIYRWDTKAKKMVFVGGVKAYTKGEADSRFAKLNDATQTVKVKELEANNSVTAKSMWIGDEGLLLGGDGNGHLTVEQDEVITDVTLNGKLATKADDVAYGVEWNNGQPTGEIQETTVKDATKNTTVATLFLAQSFNALESEVEKKADKTELDAKVDKTDIVQSTGTSTTSVMSQKAVSDNLSEFEDIITDTKEEIVQIPVQMHTDGGTNGYWYNVNGMWRSDNTRRSTEKIDVAEGEKYLVSTSIGGSTVIAYLAQWNGDTWVGVSDAFKGGSGNAVDREYIVPSGVTKIAISSYNSSLPSLKKITSLREFKSYTKVESDEKYAPISVQGIKRYGVKWSIADADDLGVRCFDAVGLSAEIAIGSTGGHSDFDNIYPWSEINRCNILVNANGAKVVTFEGETGFALDGSNGDVFVRIPKFSVEKYVKNGEEYRVISNDMNHIHPAFIEDGKVLDEIFISAFEASENGGKLYSKGGVIPANNITAQEFLNYAKAKGISYSLFDNRCVDLLFCLMSVEYGCRNSNRILGYGYSGYLQAAKHQTWLHCSVSSPSTNTITLGKPISNTVRLGVLAALAVGQNICICGNAQDGSQYNIIAQRKITSISCPTTSDNFVVSFDGEPIAVDAEVEGSTNYTYVGNAPSNCNTCETITDNGAAMTYHTGRTQRALSPIGEVKHETANVCRYRWIENPVGNVWHFLPDVTFVNGQMYVCENMRDYVCHKYTSPYKPICAVLQAQESNGEKQDIVNENFWITSLVSDIFAKGNVFGNDFDKSLVSTKAFGAYYYLSSGSVPRIISHGGGFDHLYRCNILTQRAWQSDGSRWYLYGARLMFKDIE